jgi:hypothetical protein
MNHDMKTLELAKVYESQGHYKEALEIYSFLNKEKTSDEIKASVKRIEKKMGETISGSDQKENISQEKKIAILLEKWLNLIVLKKRLTHFKKIKARLL